MMGVCAAERRPVDAAAFAAAHVAHSSRQRKEPAGKAATAGDAHCTLTHGHNFHRGADATFSTAKV